MRFFVDSDSDECAAEQHNCNVRKPRRVNYFHFDSVRNGSSEWKSAMEVCKIRNGSMNINCIESCLWILLFFPRTHGENGSQ